MESRYTLTFCTPDALQETIHLAGGSNPCAVQKAGPTLARLETRFSKDCK